MQDHSTLPKEQLLELIRDREVTLATQEHQLAVQTDTIHQLEQKIVDIDASFAKLWRERFKARSERYFHNPGQMLLDFPDSDGQAADAAAGLAQAIEDAGLTPPTPARRKKPRKKRSESLPIYLPRYEVTAIDSPESLNCETHGQRTLLPESMWDKTETLEFVPEVLKVRVTIYRKYACSNHPDCGITQPERPTAITKGNKYDTSIATEIITGKYAYHLPLYRQQDRLASNGWTPSRSTLANILTGSFFVIQSLLDYFKKVVQRDPVVGCDDTGLTLLYPKVLPPLGGTTLKDKRIHEVFTNALEKGKSSIGAHMWAYRGATIKLNVFDFTVSRHHDGPETFFQDYKGVLLGDCWNGFDKIASDSNGAMLRAACLAHARRKIFDSSAYPKDRAQWMDWFGQLYDIEDRGRAMSPEQRLLLRRTEARPIWKVMEQWLQDVKLRTTNVILPKSDFGKGLNYVRNHFQELQRYLDDALIPVDNNDCEQLMKQVAIGRKNWLFVGSVPKGEQAAGFMTLVSSAIRNDLDVHLYVKDVLDQLLAGLTDYESLLPWNWAAKNPGAIRQYRVRERKERKDNKQFRRSERRKLNVKP